MWQQRETPTERLVVVIQRIQLDRETGELTARRGDSKQAEVGTIVFVNGRVTEARLGRYTGPEALKRLSTWGNCFISFAPAQQNASREISFPVFEPKIAPPLQPGVPYQIVSVEQAMQKMEMVGLSRTHRHLFLLVNGQRSIVELTRLTGRNQRDLQLLLRDLEALSIIRVPPGDTT